MTDTEVTGSASPSFLCLPSSTDACLSSASDCTGAATGDAASQLPLNRSEVNALIYDYLKTEGYEDVAQNFRQEITSLNSSMDVGGPQLDQPHSQETANGFGDESPVKHAGLPQEAGEPAGAEMLSSRIGIRQWIIDGQLQDAMESLNDKYPELLDEDCYLHFHLLQQQLIELIRDGRHEDALKFAQRNVSEKGEKDGRILAEMEHTLALLAFQNPLTSPFANLFNIAQRGKVAREVNGAILKAEHQPSTPKLELLLRLIFWSEAQLENQQQHSSQSVEFTRLHSILTTPTTLADGKDDGNHSNNLLTAGVANGSVSNNDNNNNNNTISSLTTHRSQQPERPRDTAT